MVVVEKSRSDNMKFNDKRKVRVSYKRYKEQYECLYPLVPNSYREDNPVRDGWGLDDDYGSVEIVVSPYQDFLRCYTNELIGRHKEWRGKENELMEYIDNLYHQSINSLEELRNSLTNDIRIDIINKIIEIQKCIDKSSVMAIPEFDNVIVEANNYSRENLDVDVSRMDFVAGEFQILKECNAILGDFTYQLYLFQYKKNWEVMREHCECILKWSDVYCLGHLWSKEKLCKELDCAIDYYNEHEGNMCMFAFEMTMNEAKNKY